MRFLGIELEVLGDQKNLSTQQGSGSFTAGAAVAAAGVHASGVEKTKISRQGTAEKEDPAITMEGTGTAAAENETIGRGYEELEATVPLILSVNDGLLLSRWL